MKSDDISIYVHIPFCLRKCLYCDFNSMAAPVSLMEEYGQAVIREIENSEDILHSRKVVSVYFGGGTPSLMPPSFFDDVLTHIKSSCHMNENCEISMEINPFTIAGAEGRTKGTGALLEPQEPAGPGERSEAMDRILGYMDAGITRFSIGVQSSKDAELAALGRIHTFRDFLKSYELIKDAGAGNVSVDIMTAIPHQTMKSLEDTLDEIISLKPEHISAYSLIIEEDTPFYSMKEEELDLPDEDCSLDMDRLVCSVLSLAGYERYEISNHALLGRECIHNLGYWEGRDYAGFGISAASRMGNHRYTNTPHIKEYIMAPGRDHTEDRILSLTDEMEEFMFLGLRKTAGICISDFYECFGSELSDIYGDIPANHVSMGYAVIEGGNLRLTPRGLEISNRVLADYLL